MTNTILLAGDATRALLHDLLSESRFAVRFLTRDEGLAAVIRRLGVEVVKGGLDDAQAIRSAIRGCYGVIAAAETVLEGRTVIKVVGGSEVERFLFAGREGRDELQRFAQTVGVEPIFVDRDSLNAAASIYFSQESVEDTWRTFSLPFFL